MNSIEFSQVYSILMMLGNSYILKLPQEIISEIILNMDKSYIPEYNLGITNKGISENVREYIFYLCENYWNI